MSRENVEVVRRIHDAWGRNDLRGAAALMDPKTEWHPPPEMPDRQVARGPDEVEAAIRAWTGAWDDFRYEVLDVAYHGDHVVVSGRESGRGKDSQAKASSELHIVWTIRNGKAVRAQLFHERGQALEAAGFGG